MLKTIVFNGGLGNQMFQYAFYLGLKENHPLSLFLFDIEQSQGNHFGYELDKVFQIDSLKQARGYRRLKRYVPWLEKHFCTIRQEHSLEFNPQVLSPRRPFVRYEGFWQSEKFFLSVEPHVRMAFSFREDGLNNPTREMAHLAKTTNSISVHVRRGDYLQLSESFGLCSLDYYEKAIAYFQEHVFNPRFLFFSDDIEWVKEHLKCDNARFVSWNTGEDSWQDLYLMSQCRHHIIANSSFSWWGAWLNPSVEKIVIAPKRWFNYIPNYDVLPEKWIKL